LPANYASWGDAGTGIAIALRASIMHNNPQSDSTRVLHWVFRRNNRAITCEVEADRTHSFEVSLVPHWNVSASVIERFDAVHHAFLRHAEMARRLREAGWVRADAVPRRSSDLAA
jgi:hypothetical protein